MATRPSVEIVDGTCERRRPKHTTGHRPISSTDRKNFMSSRIDRIRVEPELAESLPDQDAETKKSFKLDAALIELLGASGLDKKAKKAYDAKRICSLGGKAPKNIKTPIPILKGIRAKNKMREKRQEALDIAAGNTVKRQKNPIERTGDSGLKIGLGKFSAGKLSLSGKDISFVENSGSKFKLSAMFRR